MHELLKHVEEQSLRTRTLVEKAQADAADPKIKDKVTATPLQFEIGDTVVVHCRILEGNKERVQKFEGVVTSRRGSGTRETFTVRRLVMGEGVERTFPTNSPKIASLEVKSHGRARRAKLYYLQNRVGKATRLRELLAPRKKPKNNGAAE